MGINPFERPYILWIWWFSSPFTDIQIPNVLIKLKDGVGESWETYENEENSLELTYIRTLGGINPPAQSFN